MAKRERTRGQPRHASELVSDIVRSLRPSGTSSEVTRRLERALGTERAAHCRVAGYRDGNLVVEVDSAPLYAELRGFMTNDLRVAMNAMGDRSKIGRITFRMGGTGHV